MPKTFNQIYLQIIFATNLRQKIINKNHREHIAKYIVGILNNRKQKPLAVNILADHAHLFIGYKPTIPLPDLMRDVKAVSSKHINENRLVAGRFNWQQGYGAFSYAQSQVHTVVQYVRNQEEHHRKKTFKEEYLEFLRLFKVEYAPEDLFEFEEVDSDKESKGDRGGEGGQ